MLSTVAVLLAVIPGCGDSTEAAPLKKPQFIQQANEICRHSEDERKRALREATEQSAGEPDQADLVTEAALPPIRTMTDELAELGAPRGDEKEVEEIVAGFERGIEMLEEAPTDVPANMAAFGEATEAAEAYGLISCGI